MQLSSIIHRSCGNEGVIEIAQEGDIRALYFGSDAKQSAMDIHHPERLVLPYTQMMMASLIFGPAAQKVLIIGLGGGSLAKFCLHYLESCEVHAVEFRSDVAKLAYGYFNLPECPQLTVYIGDGHEHILQSKADFINYDYILVDAFEHDGVANSVKQQSFFNTCYDCLSPKGVLAINLWNSKNDHYSDTIHNLDSAFFSHILTVPVADKGNVIAFAMRHENQLPKAKMLKARAHELEKQLDLPLGNYLSQIRRHNRWRGISRLLF